MEGGGRRGREEVGWGREEVGGGREEGQGRRWEEGAERKQGNRIVLLMWSISL